MRDLEAIIATYGPALARVAASYEADGALQEDLLQDVLLHIHRALPSLRDESSLAAFVFRIAHNRGVSHVIRQSAERRRTFSQIVEEEPGPEQQLLASERALRLTAAVRRLPLPYRQVLTLILEDLSYAEIGEALGISPSNVGVRLNRAKPLLKELLGDL